MLRLYIDEVGHHDLKTSDDPNERCLGLTGIIMELGNAEGQFAEQLDGIKQEEFGRGFGLRARIVGEFLVAGFAYVGCRRPKWSGFSANGYIWCDLAS